MSQELHYTSVARGLKPGSRGFGTVAATANLPEALADRLEALSVYEAVYPPGDPSAALNPVAYVHVRLPVAGRVHDVLSRIGPAGLDYSGRPNKYAHHVILEPDERPAGGPAWLLSQAGFVQDAWDGEPRILAEGTPVPLGDRLPGVARAWQELTGDAGWAGVLAESFLADPRRPVFLVFRPGIELLPQFVEAIALLPVARRWDVEFSTYLTTLPPGISCTWRGVLDGSTQAKIARRLPNALIVDLCRPLGRAQGGGLVHLARTGERLDTPDGVASASSGLPHRPGRPPAFMAGPPSRPRAASRPESSDGPGALDWLPELAARAAADESLLGGDRPRLRRRPLGVVAALVLAACLVPLLAAVFLSSALRQRLGLEAPRSAVAAGEPTRSPAVAREAPKRVEAPAEKPSVAAVDAPPAGPKNGPQPVADAARAKVDAPPAEAAKPGSPAPRARPEPLISTFTTPEVPGSTLGPANRGDTVIGLRQDTDNRIELWNGPDLRLKAVPAATPTWEIATSTNSGVGGGVALARLNRADPKTWRFDWTQNARAGSRSVEGLKDAILKLYGRDDGRPIYVLLRGVELIRDSPIVVWDKERILFDKLEPRTRSKPWAGDSNRLEGSQWKPRIRRWKVVLSRPETDEDDDDSPGLVIEPAHAEEGEASGAEPALERELIAGEVNLKLKIDQSSPGEIEVCVEPDTEKFRARRASRSERMDQLRKATPKDEHQKEQDPLAYRQSKHSKLREDATKNSEEIKALEREIEELKRINEVRGIEDLLTRPARLELSVVIGLDVDGAGILDIVRIGEFARGR
jgi:GTPase-associated protein 1, N-terminal domain type 2/GTPase-associated protein 1, middle domain